MKDRLVLETLLKDDITIYHPTKCYHYEDTFEYDCVPYSLAGTICAYSDAAELLNFLKNCYVDETECENVCIALNNHNKVVDEVYDSNPYTIKLYNPSAEEVCEAAKEAITNLKKGCVIVRDAVDNRHIFEVNGFEDFGWFGRDRDGVNITQVWAKYCEDYHIWDEFEQLVDKGKE